MGLFREMTLEMKPEKQKLFEKPREKFKLEKT